MASGNSRLIEVEARSKRDPSSEMVVGSARNLLMLLLGAVGLLLLISCANVANLMLARGAERHKEIAVRIVLGAGRMRVVRQLLVESSLLGIIGGTLGLFVAYAGTKALVALAEKILPRTQEVGLDHTVLLGAQPAEILRLVLRKGLVLAAIGLVIGIGVSLATTRLMSSPLYNISATDPLTFAAVGALLVIVALAACWIPARRAMRTDPAVTLRYE
jgi:ABC-type antimicrobial peptide transport system permease subunit